MIWTKTLNLRWMMMNKVETENSVTFPHSVLQQKEICNDEGKLIERWTNIDCVNEDEINDEDDR